MRSQLLRWLLVPIVCLCALATVAAYHLSAKFANDSYDAFLMNSADSIGARLERNKQGVVAVDLPPAVQAVLRHNGTDKFYYQIVDRDGKRLSGDALLPLPQSKPIKGPKFRYVELGGEKLRLCRIPVTLGPGGDIVWVQAAETLRSRQSLLEQIFLSILVPQFALVALASLSVWIGIQRGLIPLNKLGSILKSRSRLDFSPVELGRDSSLELMPVTDALNELFTDADEHIRLQRQFIANAAHQLRTPVTALKTSIEYIERHNKDPELDAGLRHIADATDRTVHMINRLLSLARTTGAFDKAKESVNLGEVVELSASALVPEARKKGIELVFEIPEEEVVVVGHQGDLEELTSNLLENAIKYTPANGAVWVIVSGSNPAYLTIEDNGPGIPDDEKSKVCERFYRGAAAAHSNGCGLGLSIVSEIAAANEAVLKISDRPDGGTSVRVMFTKVA